MKRPCPICGSVGPRQTLHRQRFLGGPLGDGYDVVVCGACGAGFADEIPDQAVLDRYYAGQSKYEYSQREGAESPYDFRRFEAITDQIVPFLPSRDAAILDVGCATGGLLSCFARRGYRRLLGSDPSPDCAKVARRLHGLEVRTATIRDLAPWPERFDLILLIGVLEHLRDAGEAVDLVARLLAPGGLVYCAQPDVESFTDCHNAPYQQFSVEHLIFYSQPSLSRLMVRAGLQSRHLWRWMVEWREGVTDSVVSGLFAAGPASAEHGRDGGEAPLFDRVSEPALRRYVAECRREDEPLLARIASLVAGREAVLVWGAGTLTRRLLASSRLADANIAAFVDSNPHLRGERLAGREILAPQQLADRPEAIVICSRAFEREIGAMIRDELKLKNRVITLW